MKKTLLLLSTIFTTSLAAQFNANISEITPDIKERMIQGNSWRQGCPVSLNNLRYLQMAYLDFKGQTQMGEMIVHKSIASNTVYIFEELYIMKYAIDKMQLVSDYSGNDWQSIESDNTSAFNCRPVSGKKKKWSKHAYGKAIDINPIANPYISKTGYISHKSSYKYKKRRHIDINNLADRALLLASDPATKVFKKYGWGWGGDWKSMKDYQHFFVK
jgi:poly-gamma-glutamate synthesis protein (capsule biosynthesis protein)